MAVHDEMDHEAFANAGIAGRRDGLSFQEIADQTGRSRSAVSGKCNRLGLRSENGVGRRPKAKSAKSNALGARIAALHADGLTSSEIGISLGMEIRAVRRRLRSAGLELHRPKPSRRTRPTPPDPTPPTAGAGALTYRRDPVDLTPPPETSVWFADASGCRFSCWPMAERDPMRKRCCGAEATRGSYCDHHASVVYAAPKSRAA